MSLTRERPRVRSLLALLIVALALILLARPAAAAEPMALPDLSIAVDLDPAILWPFLVIAGLLVIKWVLGFAKAARDSRFDWLQLLAILRTNVLPYLVPLATMGALGVVSPVVKALYLASAAMYAIKLLTDLKSAIAEFYGIDKPPEAV